MRHTLITRCIEEVSSFPEHERGLRVLSMQMLTEIEASPEELDEILEGTKTK